MDIRPIGNQPQSGERIEDKGSYGGNMVAAAAKDAAAALQTVGAVEKPKPIPGMEQVNEAVKNVNKALKVLSQNLEFSVDEDTHRTVVKVVDRQTNEVLRQMPTEEAVEIAKALDRVQGLLIHQKA